MVHIDRTIFFLNKQQAMQSMALRLFILDKWIKRYFSSIFSFYSHFFFLFVFSIERKGTKHEKENNRQPKKEKKRNENLTVDFRYDEI